MAPRWFKFIFITGTSLDPPKNCLDLAFEVYCLCRGLETTVFVLVTEFEFEFECCRNPAIFSHPNPSDVQR